MEDRDEKNGGAWLGRAVVLLVVVAVISGMGVLVRSCAPTPANVAPREHSVRSLAEAQAWQQALREVHLNRSLMALVFLLGNGFIVATISHATLGARGRVSKDAGAHVKRQGGLGLVAAFAILIAVPSIQSLFTSENMYSGEQGLMGLLTALSFVVVWAISLGLAFAALPGGDEEESP